MKKYNVLTKINTFLLIFILLLLFVNRYYELFSDHISVLLLCTYLSYLVIALMIVKLIKYQKGALSKIEIFGLLIIAVIISFVGRDMFSDWKNHIFIWWYISNCPCEQNNVRKQVWYMYLQERSSNEKSWWAIGFAKWLWSDWKTLLWSPRRWTRADY